MELTDYQRDILIRTALGEAAGEGKEGMAAVLHVILNRANSGQFPSDPAEVALQNKQFSTWNKGEGGNNPQKWSENSKSYRTAAAALDGVLSAKSDPTGGALYYHAKGITPYWADDVNKNGVVKIGAHRFYPSHPVPKANIPDVASASDFGPGIPTPLPAPKRTIATNAAWQPPSAAQTAAEQRLTRPDYRSLGFVPLPPPAPLRPSSVAPAAVGTPNLTTRKVNTVPVDSLGNPIIAKAALPPAPPPMTRDSMWFTSKPPTGAPTPAPSPFEKKPPNIAAAGLPIAAALDAKRALDALTPKPAAPVPQKAPIYPPTTVRAPTLQEARDEQAFMRRIPTAPRIALVTPKTTVAQLAPATLPRLPMPKPAALSRPIVPIRTAPVPAARIPLTQYRTVNPVTQIVPAVQARAGQTLFGRLFNMATAGVVPQASAPAAPGYNGSTTVTSNDLRPTHSSIFSDNALLPAGMNNRRWAGDGY